MGADPSGWNLPIERRSSIRPGAAACGELITVLDILDTGYRSGRDPDALDPYLHNLRFNIDEQKPGESAVDPRESFTSALTAIGRVVGREIDKEWLDSTHTSYTVRADEPDW
ncbi:hypothetical protein [Microbispora siamensis]|uniref:Uncharacterized protein n=1 Tax=Microbispora siamensis TaxID=564413 RepID=A0ABQ4GYK8_9ACTN|nr:hypothetical protein [Microbispora siamensis]GIH66525.1 hypothetical protein Msi02_73420 [Microbispora siamensis]